MRIRCCVFTEISVDYLSYLYDFPIVENASDIKED